MKNLIKIIVFVLAILSGIQQTMLAQCDIIGCIDAYAINYNPEANCPCDDCCLFRFDIALTKELISAGPFIIGTGASVTFSTTVTNQGGEIAQNIEITDFIPTGLILADANWTQSGSNAVTTIVGPLVAGANISVDIKFEIDPSVMSGTYTNIAEISGATDANGNLVTDIDSSPDNEATFTLVCSTPTCNDDPCAGDVTTLSADACSCEIVEPRFLGCTDSAACNFNPDANCDNSSCIAIPVCNADPCSGDVTTLSADACSCEVVEYQVLGCTDPTACNYNPDVNCPNGSCTFDCNTTNVWPGDKNNDGIVNHVDVSLVGFAGETGSARASEHQNIEWYGHPAQDWNITAPIYNVDIKHFDCNGDGIISTTDTDAVLENLGEIHNEGGNQFAAPFFEESDYQIYLQPIGNLNNGATQLDFNVVFDSKNGNNFNLQGGYFTIDYNSAGTNITNAVMNFTNSWLGNPNTNLVTSNQNFPNFQEIQIGFSKTNGTNSIGKGIIGELTLVVDNQAARTANNIINFEIIEIGFHNSQGTIQAIEEQLIQVSFGESNCEPNWFITDESPFYNTYKSSGTIQTNGFVLVGKEQQISYSGNRIRLNSGFKVKAGADFSANNSGCSSTLNCDPLFADYPPLISYVNPNTCTTQIVEEYYDGNFYYFIYIQQGNQGELYLFHNDTLNYYGSDAGDGSLPEFYGSATERVWECGC